MTEQLSSNANFHFIVLPFDMFSIKFATKVESCLFAVYNKVPEYVPKKFSCCKKCTKSLYH